jgi:hypothetical protein
MHRDLNERNAAFEMYKKAHEIRPESFDVIFSIQCISLWLQMAWKEKSGKPFTWKRTLSVVLKTCKLLSTNKCHKNTPINPFN